MIPKMGYHTFATFQFIEELCAKCTSEEGIEILILPLQKPLLHN